jgi:hypothetical protein
MWCIEEAEAALDGGGGNSLRPPEVSQGLICFLTETPVRKHNKIQKLLQDVMRVGALSNLDWQSLRMESPAVGI